MNVAIVQQHVGTQRGGAEASTLEMARHVAALGVGVHVLCQAERDGIQVADNVTFESLGVGRGPRSLRTYRFLQRVREACRSGRYDLVHAVTPCLAADVYQPRGGTYPETIARTLARARWGPWRWAKRLGRRFNVSQRFLQRIERRLLTRYAGRVWVAALSDYVRRQVVEGMGLAEDRVRIVFNGVDVAPMADDERASLRAAQRSAWGVAPGAQVVLFAGHNFALKGLAELLRATAADARGWALVVTGRGRTARYARAAARLGIAPHVHFVGPAASMRAAYAAADVVAHPTWYDPCSRVVLESLVLGVPAVTTRYNGAAEVIEPGCHGEIIDEPDDIAQLAGAVRRCLAPDVAARCRADAARMARNLSMARHARELLALYADVVRMRGDSTQRAADRGAQVG